MATLPTPPEWTPVAGFDEEKAAQIAGYFTQCSNQPIGKMKLIKLFYLSEREFLDRHLVPMTFDEFYSMKDGPIASSSLNGINGNLAKELWSSWIKLDGIKVSAARMIKSREEFDRLSDANIEVLDHIWKKFGAYSDKEIWDYVHDPKNVPEYTKVETGRAGIRYDDILDALKKDSAETIAAEIRMMQREAAIL
jgi:uncharacterized phage-associated protein